MKPSVNTIRPMRVLHVEDSKLDAELTCARLDRSGLKFECVRVDTEIKFVQSLETSDWDVILADYNLPGFTGLAALEIASRLAPDVPFIIVSGVLGEEVAIDTLKNGATDYVLKERMDRLAPAIQRALSECNERRQRREAQAALRESESRLRAALEVAEQANAAKDQFLATLSHELRTPLAPILTTVQLLDIDSTLTSEQREHVAMIRRNAELEARLIDDLLDLTRIVRGKLQLQEHPVELHQLVDGVVEICRDDFVAKHHVLEKRFEATATIVKGDAARLQQILWNLLKNAIKFTPDGGCIRIITRNTADSQIEIIVADNGIGIEVSALPRIFAPFEQADSQITHRFGGLGLGLSIAKLLAEKHAGTLVASSTGRDQGSTFTLKFPTLRDAVRPPASPNRVQLKGNPLKILLVEDHTDTGRAMARLLRMLGHQVRLTTSAGEGKAVIGEGTFDLLISDIGLPDGSGLDVVREWKVTHPNLPSIALTGFGMDHDVERCRMAGFDHHLTKPVNFEKMESLLRPLHPSATD